MKSLFINMNQLIILAIVFTVGIYLAHRYGPNWNFAFGLLFFAGIPAVELGLVGYVLGAGFLLFFVGMSYIIERVISGSWQKPQV